LFDGYWEDIGTIRSFYAANLDLARSRPPFELISATIPIFSRPRFLPPTRIDGATVRESLIADGCVIGDGATIENSVVGLRCHIARGVTIRHSVLMGSDEYESPEQLAESRRAALPPIGIGEGSVIEGAIVDKNCRIGSGVHVVNHAGLQQRDISEACVVRDGIVVVLKGASLPDGWKLE
jgi:glucose-1-phosphate adenylyltransferase